MWCKSFSMSRKGLRKIAWMWCISIINEGPLLPVGMAPPRYKNPWRFQQEFEHFFTCTMRLLKRKWVGYILLTVFVIFAALITKWRQNFVACFMRTKNSWTSENRQTDLCRKCINTKLYQAIIYPKGITKTEFDTVLLLISSYRKEAAARREAIRSTWGNTDIYLPIKMQRIFVLGKNKR